VDGRQERAAGTASSLVRFPLRFLCAWS
jgi:hypothetical protein